MVSATPLVVGLGRRRSAVQKLFGVKHNKVGTDDSVVNQAKSLQQTEVGGRNIYTVLNDLVDVVKTARIVETINFPVLDPEFAETLPDTIQRKLDETSEGNWDVIEHGKGQVGETILHLAMLLNTQDHKLLCCYVVSRCRSLLDEPMTGSEYLGEVALHFAVINKDFEMLKFLVEAGADCRNPRATGKFFERQDMYYGEYVLGFAVSTGQGAMVKYLLELDSRIRPQIDAQDSNGNTALHMTVLHNRPGMYDLLILYDADCTIRNKNGHTPMTLAAAKGKKDMFQHIWYSRRKVIWSYGPVTCAKYPLGDIESAPGIPTSEESLFVLNPKSVRPSALASIVQEGHREMLELPGILRLLNDKWDSFGEVSFRVWFTLNLVALLCLAVTISIDPEDDSSVFVANAFFSIPISVTLLTILREYNELSQSGIREYMSGTGWHENALTILYCFFMITALPLRILEYPSFEVMLSGACVSGWFYLLLQMRGFEKTGPFVQMIYVMLVNDVLTFAFIYITVLVGFSQAFYVLYAHDDQFHYETLSSDDHFGGPGASLMSLFRLTFVDFEFELIRLSPWPRATQTLYVMYMVVVGVLLFNLLIAMMANTYTTMLENSHREWRLQWANIILVVEKGYPIVPRYRPQSHVFEDGEWWLIMETTTGLDYYDAAPGKSHPHHSHKHGKRMELRRTSVSNQISRRSILRQQQGGAILAIGDVSVGQGGAGLGGVTAAEGSQRLSTAGVCDDLDVGSDADKTGAPTSTAPVAELNTDGSGTLETPREKKKRRTSSILDAKNALMKSVKANRSSRGLTADTSSSPVVPRTRVSPRVAARRGGGERAAAASASSSDSEDDLYLADTIVRVLAAMRRGCPNCGHILDESDDEQYPKPQAQGSTTRLSVPRLMAQSSPAAPSGPPQNASASQASSNTVPERSADRVSSSTSSSVRGAAKGVAVRTSGTLDGGSTSQAASHSTSATTSATTSSSATASATTPSSVPLGDRTTTNAGTTITTMTDPHALTATVAHMSSSPKLRSAAPILRDAQPKECAKEDDLTLPGTVQGGDQ